MKSQIRAEGQRLRAKLLAANELRKWQGQWTYSQWVTEMGMGKLVIIKKRRRRMLFTTKTISPPRQKERGAGVDRI
jgi:hypothetical protein